MPLIYEPKPLPSPLDYVPPSSEPYKAKANESWWTLAELPQVKTAGLSANDLCFFNFKTRRPQEINWYLKNKVGCRMTTRDGANYRFSGADTPGVIYLPRIGEKLPVNEFPKEPQEPRLNAWLGIGGKAGTQFVVVGIETLAGYVVSLDDVGKGIGVAASINRIGPGFGVGGGVSIIYVTGVNSPSKLMGHQQGDWDFNLSLGPNWGKAAKSAKSIGKLKPLVDMIMKLGAKTPAGLKQLLKAHPDKWVELIKQARSLKDTLGIDPNGPPNVAVIDVPFAGGGTEASVFFGLANFEAVWDNAD